MAKYHDVIGYANTENKGNGVWELLPIVEREYFGDVIRNTRRLENGENLNDNLRVGNSISIIADAYAYENFFNIRYAKWMGILWRVESIEVQRPRLILTLGGVYNGE